MEQFIIDLAQNIVKDNLILSYLFFFVSQSLQILFPPYPGDMILVLEGYLSEITDLNLILTLINAVVSTSLSSFLLYNIGRKKQERILKSKVINVLFATEKINKLNKLFKKFGAFMIVISKFIPGIFSLTLLAAGIFRVKKEFAYLSIIIISFLHNGALIILGKFVGENWSIMFRKLNIYNRYIIILGVVAIIIYLIMIQLKRKIFD